MYKRQPQKTVRDGYLNLLSILAEKDPLVFARELELDADQLGLLIHDRAKATTIAKQLAVERREEDKREKIKVLKKTAAEPKKMQPPAVVPAEVKAGVMETVLPDEPVSPPLSKQEKQPKGGGRQSTLF